MELKGVFDRVQDVFRDIFDEDDLVISQETTASDVDGWDSLSHIQLIVAIEKEFKIKFSSKEILSWKNVGELLNSVQEKVTI